MTPRNLTLLAAILTAALFTCEPVPDFCGTGEIYDPSCEFCHGSRAYQMCPGEKKAYNPLTQGCLEETESAGKIGTRCANGKVVPTNTPCGGYTLTTAVTPEGKGAFSPQPDTTKFNAGDPLFLGAEATDPDYEFAGWGGTISSQENRWTYTMTGPNAQVLVVAMFKPKAAGKLETDVFPKDAGTVSRSPDKEIYGVGERVTVTATAAAGSGFAFDGWSGADVSKNNPTTVTMNESKTLVAIFTPATRSLKASVRPANSGAVFINNTPVASGRESAVGTTVEAWARADARFAFSYWETKGGATVYETNNQLTTVTIDANAADAAITAVFVSGDNEDMDRPLTTDTTGTGTAAKYEATVSSAGTGATGGGLYVEGTTVNINAGIAPDGQQFKNWTTTSSGVTFADANDAATTFKMPANAVTVTAVFVGIADMCLWNQNGDCWPLQPDTFSLCQENAWLFQGGNIGEGTFCAGGTFIGGITNTPPTDITIPIKPAQYQVTIENGGEKYRGDDSYQAGATVTIYAGEPWDACQRFKNWTVTKGGAPLADANSSTTTFTMPSNDVTVRAVFEDILRELTVFADPPEGGDVTPAYKEDIAPGTQVDIKADAKSGFTFSRWEVNNAVSINGCNPGETVIPQESLNSANITVTVYMSAIFTAYFTKDPEVVDPSTVVKGTFTDSRDGTTYKTVKIGSQTWMAENLNFDTADGTGSWCYYNSADSCVKYGRLYDWNTAMGGSSSSNANPSGVKGVCPTGWHLPSNQEWSALVTAVGSPSGTKLKSTSGWYYNGNGTDEYGFSALPGGGRLSGGSFDNAGYYGYWWTATEYSESYAYGRHMSYNSDSVYEGFSGKSYGVSVRCIAD